MQKYINPPQPSVGKRKYCPIKTKMAKLLFMDGVSIVVLLYVGGRGRVSRREGLWSLRMCHFCVMGWNEVSLNSSIASVILVPYREGHNNNRGLIYYILL
jgi:hypothetical protein